MVISRGSRSFGRIGTVAPYLPNRGRCRVANGGTTPAEGRVRWPIPPVTRCGCCVRSGRARAPRRADGRGPDRDGRRGPRAGRWGRGEAGPPRPTRRRSRGDRAARSGPHPHPRRRVRRQRRPVLRARPPVRRRPGDRVDRLAPRHRHAGQRVPRLPCHGRLRADRSRRPGPARPPAGHGQPRPGRSRRAARVDRGRHPERRRMGHPVVQPRRIARVRTARRTGRPRGRGCARERRRGPGVRRRRPAPRSRPTCTA